MSATKEASPHLPRRSCTTRNLPSPSAPSTSLRTKEHRMPSAASPSKEMLANSLNRPHLSPTIAPASAPPTELAAPSATSMSLAPFSPLSTLSSPRLLRAPPKRVPRPCASATAANLARSGSNLRSSRHIMIATTRERSAESLTPSLSDDFIHGSSTLFADSKGPKEEISVLVHTFSNMWQRQSSIASTTTSGPMSALKPSAASMSCLPTKDGPLLPTRPSTLYEGSASLSSRTTSPSKKKTLLSRPQGGTSTASSDASTLRRSPRFASSPFYGSSSSGSSSLPSTPLKKQALLKSTQQEAEALNRAEPGPSASSHESGLDAFSRLITSSPRRLASANPAASTPVKVAAAENKENLLASPSTMSASVKSPQGHHAARAAAASVVTKLKKLVHHREPKTQKPVSMAGQQAVDESTSAEPATAAPTASPASLAGTGPSALSAPSLQAPISLPVSISGSSLFSPGFTHVELEPELAAVAEGSSGHVDPHSEFDVCCEEFVEAVQFIATLPSKSSLPPHPCLPKHSSRFACSSQTTTSELFLASSFRCFKMSLTSEETHLRSSFRSSRAPTLSYGILPEKTEGLGDKLTLVLDLDETLVHCSVGKMEPCDLTFQLEVPGRPGPPFEVSVRWRPHLFTFLNQIQGKFEVILFTASQKIYADTLLNILDPEKLIFQHRLFRDSCRWVNGNFIKDLDVLDRDLSQTIIVDNAHQAYSYHVSNGYPIVSWYDDPNDIGLLRLWDFLKNDALACADRQQDIRHLMRHRFPLYKHIVQYRKQHHIQGDFEDWSDDAEEEEASSSLASDVPMNDIRCNEHHQTY